MVLFWMAIRACGYDIETSVNCTKKYFSLEIGPFCNSRCDFVESAKVSRVGGRSRTPTVIRTPSRSLRHRGGTSPIVFLVPACRAGTSDRSGRWGMPSRARRDRSGANPAPRSSGIVFRRVGISSSRNALVDRSRPQRLGDAGRRLTTPSVWAASHRSSSAVRWDGHRTLEVSRPISPLAHAMLSISLRREASPPHGAIAWSRARRPKEDIIPICALVRGCPKTIFYINVNIRKFIEYILQLFFVNCR